MPRQDRIATRRRQQHGGRTWTSSTGSQRTIESTQVLSRVWTALTTAERLGARFGDEATIELQPGGQAGRPGNSRAHRRPPRSNGSRDPPCSGSTAPSSQRDAGGRSTPGQIRPSSSTLQPYRAGTRLTVVEQPVSPSCRRVAAAGYDSHAYGWARSWANLSTTSMPPDLEATRSRSSRPWADLISAGSWPSWPREAGGDATGPRGNVCRSPPGDRQAPSLLADARAGDRGAGAAVPGDDPRRNPPRCGGPPSSSRPPWPATGQQAESLEDHLEIKSYLLPMNRRAASA